MAEVGVVVNLRKGFTHRLAVIVDKETIKVLFDGLYGPFPDVGSFNSAIFVAGPGVSHTLPLLLDTVDHVPDGKVHAPKQYSIGPLMQRTMLAGLAGYRAFRRVTSRATCRTYILAALLN